jgi:hypothetical protein
MGTATSPKQRAGWPTVDRPNCISDRAAGGGLRSRRSRERAAKFLDAQEVCTRWQDSMAGLLQERVPDAGPPPLEAIFRLD